MTKKQNKKIEKIEKEKEYKKPLVKRRKPNRSIGGDIVLYLFLLGMAYIMAFPIIFTVSNSLKP
ncbi:MAG: carbohydrate ABC transporter permease, partial [Lachnospiraceae bacterium]|nr:carbohydrate ABC transporter permease [Lachnospiraceae bacterium]